MTYLLQMQLVTPVDSDFFIFLLMNNFAACFENGVHIHSWNIFSGMGNCGRLLSLARDVVVEAYIVK